jgi:Spy/CpxP family protein refolding chaperone
MAAMLALAASFGLPLAGQAQIDATSVSSPTPTPMAGHHGYHHRRHDPFMRALHTLTLTADQKNRMKSFFAATRQSNEHATSAERKVNNEKLHTQITALLTPEQQRQLKTELAKRHAEWMRHREASPAPIPTST